MLLHLRRHDERTSSSLRLLQNSRSSSCLLWHDPLMGARPANATWVSDRQPLQLALLLHYALVSRLLLPKDNPTSNHCMMEASILFF